jgi:hypothetical protein
MPVAAFKNDSVVAIKESAPVSINKEDEYRFEPMQSHWVMILLDKVDPIYVSETRGALMRYVRTGFSNRNIEVTSNAINDQFSVIQMGSFPDLEEAMRFLSPTKQQATSRILPWLSSDKYRFVVISTDNLALLKAKKDPETYLFFLNEQMPGKF